MWVIGIDLCEEFQCRDLCMYIDFIGNTKLLSGKAVKACSSRSLEVVAQPVKGGQQQSHACQTLHWHICATRTCGLHIVVSSSSVNKSSQKCFSSGDYAG